MLTTPIEPAHPEDTRGCANAHTHHLAAITTTIESASAAMPLPVLIVAVEALRRTVDEATDHSSTDLS